MKNVSVTHYTGALARSPRILLTAEATIGEVAAYVGAGDSLAVPHDNGGHEHFVLLGTHGVTPEIRNGGGLVRAAAPGPRPDWILRCDGITAASAEIVHGAGQQLIQNLATMGVDRPTTAECAMNLYDYVKDGI